MTDLAESYPARDALLKSLEAAGVVLGQQSAPVVHGRQRVARLADAVDELRAAFGWARRIVAATPTARVAVVVAGLAERQSEVARLISTTAGDGSDIPIWSGGQPVGRDAAVGAAFNALTLLSPRTPYAAFGRWLCSRSFHVPPGELAARAQLDARLRAELRAQAAFATAYRHCGLATTLEQRAPLSAALLRDAFAAVGAPARATPSRWAHLWTRYLRELAWLTPPAGPRLLGWQASLDELARLTPVLGELSIDAALLELERILLSPAPAPLPVRGVHLLGRIEQVGPGYSAAWATGFTDAYWPEAPMGTPLLPRALQRTHGMPRATPQDARDRSARSLARLARRVPELIVSWPARVYDYETEPSPAVRDWPRATDEIAVMPHDPLDAAAHYRGGRGTAVSRHGPPRRRRNVEPAGALPVARVLPGPAPRPRARTPRLRFVESTARHRRAPHSRGTPAESADAGGAHCGEPRPACTGCGASFELRVRKRREAIARALRARARTAAAGCSRHGSTARNPVGPSRCLRSNRRARCNLAAGRYRCAWTDSIDSTTVRLRSSTTKPGTARRARTGLDHGCATRRCRCTRSRPPSHSAPLSSRACARRRPRYSGVWPAAAFAGRAARLPADWPTQLEDWRMQLEQLAEEFAAGDVRVFAADSEDAGGAYAPLTRIAEQWALARGAVRTW